MSLAVMHYKNHIQKKLFSFAKFAVAFIYYFSQRYPNPNTDISHDPERYLIDSNSMGTFYPRTPDTRFKKNGSSQIRPYRKAGSEPRFVKNRID